MNYGMFIRGLYAGSMKRKEKQQISQQGVNKISDGYNCAVTDGKGNFWRVKVEEDPAEIVQFGDTITICITNVNAYNGNIYYSGCICPELPE